MAKVSYSIRETVEPLSEGKAVRRLTHAGEISSLRVVFPDGQESQLQLVPWVRSPSGRVQPLILFSEEGEQFISGSGTVRESVPSVQVYRGDTVEVEYESIDDTYDRNLIVDFEVEVLPNE